jgi:hypothetical protein
MTLLPVADAFYLTRRLAAILLSEPRACVCCH